MRSLFFLVLLFSLLSFSVFPQDCSPPSIIVNSQSVNYFTPEQEMYLGDAMMERVGKNYRIIDDEEINSYLQRIGDKISAHLPPTGIRFRFVVVDTPDTNAYAMAGGRIMFTRKMINFLRSEDELAGVIGHELGHGVVRHGAIDMSRSFKEVLGVTSFNDRKDVFDKYNRLIDLARTKRVSTSDDHENAQQLEADRIGVFAAFAAGYDPNAMTAFWKRLTEAKKVGFFGSLFGESRPADKRLSEMLQAIKDMPPKCIDKRSSTAESEFIAWKSFVLNYVGLGAKEALSGVVYRRELVPLQPDLSRLKFNADGRYLIAQDDSTVTVLLREPFSVIFQIPAESSLPAEFSPDSRSIYLFNKSLRVQKWDIPTQKLVETYDFSVTGGGFWQAKISADGKFVACFKYNGDLVLYDIGSGNEIYKKKDFYIPTYYEVYLWRLILAYRDQDQVEIFNIQFSPDSKHLLVAKKMKFDWMLRPNPSLALDLSTLKSIPVGDSIKRAMSATMAFISSDKIIATQGSDTKKSGIFGFPDGKRLEQFELGGENFSPSYSGDYVAVSPVNGAAVGIFDLKQKKFVLGNGKPAIDCHEKICVSEKKDGEISLINIGSKEISSSIALPTSKFGNLRSVVLSSDGRWLVASGRTRGAAWDLRNGDRKLHVRAFRGAYITPDAKVFADFPKIGLSDRAIAMMDLEESTIKPTGSVLSGGTVRQVGPYLVRQRSAKAEKEDNEKRKNEFVNPFSEIADNELPNKNTVLEMYEVGAGSLLWTREFLEERPEVVINPVYHSMLMIWNLDSDAAKQIIKEHPELKTERDRMGEKKGDQLIELVDPVSGVTNGYFFLETGEGSFSADAVRWSGDYIVVSDDRNRILVYSVSTGKLINRFFGSYPAISASLKTIAVENSPGRVILYNMITGKELSRLSFTNSLSLMQFVEGGEKLFVLTSNQTAYLFEVAKLDREGTIPTM